MSDDIKSQFLNFIEQEDYPCIGAKAAAKKDLITFVIAEDIRCPADDVAILKTLYEFINTWEQAHESLQTAVILFKTALDVSEKEFENILWNRLQHLHELDVKKFAWDESVSPIVTDPDFSFSLGNNGFFIVALHSNSSRKARRFAYPAMAFNLHAQFDRLRDEDVFDRMRDKIRERDIHYSGSINPMVEDFGVVSEALQYSGRKVNDHFRCPFNWHPKDKK